MADSGYVQVYGASIYCFLSLPYREIQNDGFYEGAELRLLLRANTAPGSSSDDTILSATIIQAFRPFTMSPVLRVHLSTSDSSHQPRLPTDAVLKLYDRRCLVNKRAKFDDGRPWTLDKEREYRQYISGSRSQILDEDYRWEHDDVSDGEFEAYLAGSSLQMFEAERSAYERLSDLQGNQVPLMYGVVQYTYQVTVSSSAEDSAPTTYTETVPGILMEYISPLIFRELVKTWTTHTPPLPNSVLVALCEEAVALVDHVSDFDILNEDVRLDNFLVRTPFIERDTALTQPLGEEQPPTLVAHPVVLIDLGQCRLRRPDEDEDAWRAARQSQDETGAVGFALLGIVRECVGADVWTYKRSHRWHSRPGVEPINNFEEYTPAARIENEPGGSPGSSVE